MKCANCDALAELTVTYVSARPTNYCYKCVPAHLRANAYAGAYPLNVPKKPRKKVSNESLQGTSEASTSDTE